MKIQIDLPQDVSIKDVSYDQKSGALVIEPRFFKGRFTQSIGYVTIKGDGGRKRAAVLQINGRTGDCKLVNEPEEVTPEFDKPATARPSQGPLS